MAKITKTVATGGNDNLIRVLGVYDENLNSIIRETGVKAFVDKTDVKITGEESDVNVAATVFEKLVKMADAGETADKSRLSYCIALAKEGNADGIESVMKKAVAVTARGKQIKCRTLGQKTYVEAIKNSVVTFGIGPAGTGKTYLAVAMAAASLKGKEVTRIVLTRPAVEAGEKLGFLPGDLQEKVDPYLRPLYDALREMFGDENFAKLLERGTIEIAPLAYMRGRTLSDAFIILDEAQNATDEQMKMFLTRFGDNSKVVVTGDLTQTDLPEGRRSGLKRAAEILKDVEGVSAVYLTAKDVVRNPLVASIVKAYENSEKTADKPITG